MYRMLTKIADIAKEAYEVIDPDEKLLSKIANLRSDKDKRPEKTQQ